MIEFERIRLNLTRGLAPNQDEGVFLVRQIEALHVLVHGHCQTIRGMCTDEADWREIDRALVRLDDAVNPPEEES